MAALLPFAEDLRVVLHWWPRRKPLPWSCLEPSYAADFAEFVAVAERYDQIDEQKRAAAARPAPDASVRERVTRVLTAHLTYRLLFEFSHGGEFDITNQFFGPARLMLSKASDVAAPEWPSEWRQIADVIWTTFNSKVLSVLEMDREGRFGEYGRQLLRHGRRLGGERLDWSLLDRRRLSDVEAIMDVLTACRTMSGRRTPREDPPGFQAPYTPVASIRRGPGHARYRVLIVDDHAAAWRPVFADVWERLGDRFDVQFDFSVDGETIGDGQPLRLALSEYHLVLLDVFLGARNGLDLLDVIKRHFLHLPVVVWTSSRDIEIPANASLSNGFLFKKRTTVDEIALTIGTWLEEGNARQHAIPNRLFDLVIKTPEYRSAINNVTAWSLQQLDNFPLIGSFFANFTNHGGRHIAALLDYVEPLVRPALLDDSLFSDDLGEREEELVSLYLALLCHELGMFPLFDADGPADSLTDASQERMRALHALRGMVFLMEPARESPWRRDLAVALAPVMRTPAGNRIVAILATLIGYHSRVLSLEERDFLRLTTSASDRIFKAYGAAMHDEAQEFVGRVSATLQSLHGTFTRVGERTRERVRKLCGLFRFVDAIDIDSSRLPPRFVREARRQTTAKNEREYLKRELVQRVAIDQRRVHLAVNLPPPDAETASLIDQLQPSHGEGSAAMLTIEQLRTPWDPAVRDRIEALQPRLNTWLEERWTQVLQRDGRPAADQQRVIAAATALTVAGEILEEYRAIIDCGLSDLIAPGRFEWVGGAVASLCHPA